MNPWWLVSYVALWLVVLSLGFLLLGALRALGLLRWRLEQLEATTPSRTGRGGLRPGKRAPDFTLPCASGGEASLHDFAGRRVPPLFCDGGNDECLVVGVVRRPVAGGPVPGLPAPGGVAGAGPAALAAGAAGGDHAHPRGPKRPQARQEGPRLHPAQRRRGRRLHRLHHHGHGPGAGDGAAVPGQRRPAGRHVSCASLWAASWRSSS